MQKRYRLKTQYGLSVEDFEKRLVAQDGKCLICQEPFTEDSPPVVDHDHKTGAIRGLLCNNHNFLLGLAGDDVDVLVRAIQYLRGQL